MENKHTPKYQVAFGGDYNGFRYAVVSDDEPSHIATIEIPAEMDSDKFCAARDTAHLFAAAPQLLEALVPFAHYFHVMSAMGGTTPKSGVVWGCHSKNGDAEITVEDMKRAQDLIALATGKEPSDV